jgi:hypothetical protein
MLKCGQKAEREAIGIEKGKLEVAAQSAGRNSREIIRQFYESKNT